MNVVIIEDERQAALRLTHLLSQVQPGINVVATLDSLANAIHWFPSNPCPDLIFLDIQLGDGLSFELFNQIELQCPVIFTTAYDEYAIKAFQLNSIDYLLKPIREEALKKSLEKYNTYCEIFSVGSFHSQIKEMLTSYSTKSIYRSRFLVNIADELIPIPIEKVAYFFTEDKVVFLITHDGQKYSLNFSIEQIEKEIDPGLFFRVNRQYLVSIKSIKKIYNYFNYKLKILLNSPVGSDIIVSKGNVGDFKLWLNK